MKIEQLYWQKFILSNLYAKQPTTLFLFTHCLIIGNFHGNLKQKMLQSNIYLEESAVHEYGMPKAIKMVSWIIFTSRTISKGKTMQKSITHRKVRPTQDRFSNVVEHDTSQIDFGSLLRLISVQSLSRVRLFVTPWITAQQASLSITNSQSLPKLMSI